MITTKVFQRVLAIFLVIAGLFLANGLNNVAHAEKVQIYDGNVNDILNDIRKSENNIKRCKEDAEFRDYMIKGLKEEGYSDIQIKELMSIDLKLRGTHYWNDKNGFRYCESHFGDSDKNRLIFQVNNDGSVSSAWIIAPIYTLAGEKNYEGSKIAGLLSGSIYDKAGMNEEQIHNLGDEMANWLDNWSSNHESGELPNKTFSVWCAKSKRYIDVNIFADKSFDFFNYFIYAHI